MEPQPELVPVPTNAPPRTTTRSGDVASGLRAPPLWERFLHKVRPRRAGIGIVLQTDGQLDVGDVRGILVQRKTGAYVPEEGGRFYNRYWIPPGWVTFWPGNDPEPIKVTGQPVGLSAMHLNILTGHYPSKLIGAGFTPPKTTVDLKRLALAVGALLLAGLAAYFYYRQRGGV